MEVLRVVLHQTSANYRKEETVDNKMTYPLPPISTVIGAIHSACGYKEYHDMKISIQGQYESMHKEPYTHYAFLNSTMDDRGMLVKMKNETMLSTAFEKVASAKKSQGNSFRNNITINVYNEELLKEYQKLKDLSDEIDKFKRQRIDPVMELIKKRKKRLAEKKKAFDKKSEKFTRISKKEKEIKDKEKYIKQRFNEFKEINFVKPYSRFRVLTTSLKFYEILDEIDLIIHISSDDATLKDIEENIYNLKSIGRSEDFVDILSVDRVELEDANGNQEIIDSYSSYVDIDLVRNEKIFTKEMDYRHFIVGTKYNMNRDYLISEDNKRIFNKKKVIYVSDFSVENTEGIDNLYVDRTLEIKQNNSNDGKTAGCIVNLL